MLLSFFRIIQQVKQSYNIEMSTFRRFQYEIWIYLFGELYWYL